MTIEINHRQTEIPEGRHTLSEILVSQGMGGKGQAVAVNNRVIPRTDWESFIVESGVKITVISAVRGG